MSYTYIYIYSILRKGYALELGSGAFALPSMAQSNIE